MKVSIRWIEVLLIALISITAMAIWTETDRQLGITMKGYEPNEIEIQQNHGVQSLQLDLVTQQKRLEALVNRLSERDVEQTTQANELQSLMKTYPQLMALQLKNAQMAPLSTLQVYVQARREMSETTLLVNRLETDFTAAVSSTISLSNMLASTNDSAQRQALEAQLVAAQSLRDSLQISLVEARITLPAPSAKISSLEAVYPQLARLTSEQQAPLALPTDVVQAYVDAQHKQFALEAEIAALTGQAQAQQTQVLSQTIALAHAQREATQDLTEQQDGFSWLRRLITLGVSLVGFMLILGLAYALIAVASNTELVPRRKLVILVSFAVVLVLLGFQTFQALGVVVMTSILMLILFAVLARSKAASGSVQNEESHGSSPRS